MMALVEKFLEALRRGHRFLTHDIWRIGVPGETPPHGVVIKQLRACILLLRGVTEETIMLRASALTFATILFIIPFLVFMFFIIQTFNLGDYAYNTLNEYIETRVAAAVQLLHERDQQQPPAPGELNPPAADPASPDGEAESASSPQDEWLKGIDRRIAEILAQPGTPNDISERIIAMVPQVKRDTAGSGRFRMELTDLLQQGQKDQTDIKELTRQVKEHIQTEVSNTKLAQKMLALMFPIFEDRQLLASGGVNPIETLLQQAQSAAQRPGAIGIAGLLFVLSTVFGFMRNVEYTFNRIWGVQQTRNIVRSISDYMMITLLLPFGAAMMLGVNAALESQYVTTQLGLAALPLRGGPFLILCFTFTLLYYFVPNTKVKFRYAAVSGGVAAGVWSLLSWALLRFWFQLARYQIFYSSLALVPLLLLWIYFSWLTLLFGALLSFAYQNEATFALERFADKASHAYREALAVRVAVEAARRFQKGLSGLSVEIAARSWNVPSRLLHETLAALTEAGLITACATEPVTYQPGRSPETILVSDVMRVIRDAGFEPSKLRDDSEYAVLYRELEQGDRSCLKDSIASVALRLNDGENGKPAEPALQ